MILQALQQYYHRKRAEDVDSLPTLGQEHKIIDFIINLDDGGRFLGFHSLREYEGKRLRGGQVLVPAGWKRAGQGVSPFPLWDNVGYVLGVDTKDKPERAKRQFDTFRERVAELLALAPEDVGLRAVDRFYSAFPTRLLEADPLWEEICTLQGNLTFKLAGDSGYVCQRPSLLRIIKDEQDAAFEVEGICALTGEKTRIERLHNPIKGVAGAQSMGGSVVSFNLDAFNSYGKKQGYNAPIGRAAVFEYSTALNHLLRHKSQQRLVMGQIMTVVFWADRADPIEVLFGACFGDDPDDATDKIRALIQGPWSGTPAATANVAQRFFVLGMAPNSARLAVKLWMVDTPRQIGTRIIRHFDDLEIVHREGSKPLTLHRLLGATAFQWKTENVSPRLVSELLRTALTGGPYPMSVVGPLLQRCRVDGVHHARAALLKAWHNRYLRQTGSNEKEMTVTLDPTNDNVGYTMGRLFAVLERLQESSHPNLNATIRDRYYGSASAAPRSVFPVLMRLKNHHLAKLDSPGLKIFFDRLLGEIMSFVEDFPAHLDLANQGRFAIGYYHQRQNLFTKTNPEEETNE